jgi:tetratricopeptide (TPR) repeat protein
MLPKLIWRAHNISTTGCVTMPAPSPELEIARRGLPNDPRLFEVTGYILRRRGQHEEGLQNLQRAVELDPRNFFTLQQIALSYQFLGRYADSIAALDRALAIMPDNLTRALRGLFYFCWKADTRPAAPDD